MSTSDLKQDEVTAERLAARLSGFVQGLGISSADARQIVDRVIASEPLATDEELLAKARTWILDALR